MNKPLNILIMSDQNAGLAEIMSGYLAFYTEGMANITLSGKYKVIHPLAEQVLIEDGIEYLEPPKSTKTAMPDLTIFINKKTKNETHNDERNRYVNFRNPLELSDYDEVLTAYRILREEIKKECIFLVGELSAGG